MTIEELKELKTWGNFKFETTSDGKTTKVPYDYDGKRVSANPKDMDRWCDYRTAEVQVKDTTADGIALFLSQLNFENTSTKLSLAAIDIDHRNLEDEVTQDILNVVNTYAEKSPSGNGYHLLFLVDTGQLPPLEKFKEMYYMKNPYNKVECYVASLTNRFLTFTENRINNMQIEERTQEFLHFLDTHMKRNINFSEYEEVTIGNDNYNEADVPTSNKIIIDTILKTNYAEKFNKLFYDGDKSEYNNDDSSADMGLANILAYFVGPNFDRIDNLMKQSKLYRMKWNREDYKEMTIKKAIAGRNGDFFNWSNEAPPQEKEYTGATIDSITAEELIQLDLEPLEPIVPQMLYPGVSLVAGAPKVGKSWYCIDLGISVANGNQFLIFNTNKSDVLYLALEDSVYRLKERIKRVLGTGQQAPKSFHIATSCNRLDEGLLAELQNKLNENPKIKLIIIDTLQKVRGTQQRAETWYSADYKEVGKLKKFADINKICILVVHHLRKQKDTDVFNQISGSTGLTGAADTMIVLNKMDNANGEVMMSITGRDVDYTETVLKFNKSTFKWEIAGQVSDFEGYKQQLTYQKNPIVIAIKALLAEHPEGFSMTATELLKAIHSITGVMPKQNKPQTLSREINETLQFQLWDYDKIHYEASNPNGGSAGRKMYFAKNTEKIITE